MNISFVAFQPSSDGVALAQFLTSQQWPFHVHSSVSEEQILQSVREGNYSGENNHTFWIVGADEKRIGIVRLFEMDDIEDGAPVFDIRISSNFQGLGIGRSAVKWLTNYLFNGWPSLQRIEGTTRVDNVAMRKVFEFCGYVKEGHYRQSWPDEDGALKDTVSYAILRSDWLSGTRTPVKWTE